MYIGIIQSGTGGSGTINETPWQVKTSAYVAAVSDRILADTSTSGFTITLPSTPTTGNQVVIADASGTFATNNLTVSGNGSNILGSTQDFILDVSNQSVTLVYYNSTTGWVLGN